MVVILPSQNSLAVEGRCSSRSSSICHSQEFCGSCFLAEDASIFFGENQYEDGKFARSRLHILGLGIGLPNANCTNMWSIFQERQLAMGSLQKAIECLPWT